MLKRASASRPSGEWSDDDYDVLCEGAVVGRIARGHAMVLDAGLCPPRRPHADPRLRSDLRGCDGGIREELAAEVTKKRRTRCESRRADRGLGASGKLGADLTPSPRGKR